MLWKLDITVGQLETHIRKENFVFAKISEISRHLCRSFEILSISVNRSSMLKSFIIIQVLFGKDLAYQIPISRSIRVAKNDADAVLCM